MAVQQKILSCPTIICVGQVFCPMKIVVGQKLENLYSQRKCWTRQSSVKTLSIFWSNYLTFFVQRENVLDKNYKNLSNENTCWTKKCFPVQRKFALDKNFSVINK